MNKQPVALMNDEKEILDVEYPIVEHFYTIQGEGAHSGRASYFIRTAGCDVNCWWCDVKESWEEEGHPVMKVSELVEVVKRKRRSFCSDHRWGTVDARSVSADKSIAFTWCSDPY